MVHLHNVIHPIHFPYSWIFIKILHFQIFMKKCQHNFETSTGNHFRIWSMYLKARVVVYNLCSITYLDSSKIFSGFPAFHEKMHFQIFMKKCQYNFEKPNEDHFQIWLMYLKALVVVFKCCFNCIPWFIQYLFRIPGFSS